MATRANRTQLPLVSRNGASAPERVFWKQGRGQAAEIRTVGVKLTTRGPRAGADGSTARPEVPRQVPLSVAIPVFEAASPEEEDHLQDVWAALLVNAADASGGVEIKRAFVRILQDLSAMEGRLLQAFCDAPGETTGVFWTRSLPNPLRRTQQGSGGPETAENAGPNRTAAAAAARMRQRSRHLGQFRRDPGRQDHRTRPGAGRGVLASADQERRGGRHAPHKMHYTRSLPP